MLVYCDFKCSVFFDLVEAVIEWRCNMSLPAFGFDTKIANYRFQIADCWLAVIEWRSKCGPIGFWVFEMNRFLVPMARVNSQHSTFNSQQSTVNSQESTVNSQESTVKSQRPKVKRDFWEPAVFVMVYAPDCSGNTVEVMHLFLLSRLKR